MPNPEHPAGARTVRRAAQRSSIRWCDLLRPALWMALVVLLSGRAWAAGVPAPVDPALQARMMHLAAELRCLVCQNQDLADSHADLARDLRRQILEQMQQGRSDQQIRDYLVERYGDFVLYRPPLKATTLLLWFGPAVLVALGLLALRRSLRERVAHASDAPLSGEEQQRVQRLLQHEEGA